MWGRGELSSCPNYFVWDCRKEEFKECHTIHSKKVGKEGSCTVSRGQLTSATKEKRRAMASFIWLGTQTKSHLSN